MYKYYALYYTADMYLKRIFSLFIACMLIITTSVFALPKRAEAVNPFGGQINQVIMCYNDVIWTNVGPPRGGRYIWAPGVTRTYEYGPPRRAGQWLLGLFGAPYFCIVSPLPLIIFPGLLMTMLGSSK